MVAQARVTPHFSCLAHRDAGAVCQSVLKENLLSERHPVYLYRNVPALLSHSGVNLLVWLVSSFNVFHPITTY